MIKLKESELFPELFPDHTTPYCSLVLSQNSDSAKYHYQLLCKQQI